jgi:hypothetical protein
MMYPNPNIIDLFILYPFKSHYTLDDQRLWHLRRLWTTLEEVTARRRLCRLLPLGLDDWGGDSMGFDLLWAN